MELRDYVHKRGRSLLILLLLPLLAGAAAFAVLQGRPQQYHASVQVAVPEIYAVSDSRIGLYIADFGQALTDNDLQDAVHDATRVSTKSLDSLSASRVKLSSRLQVELTTPSSQRATREAVVAAAKAARLKLANQGLDVQQAAVQQAQQALDTAQTALTDYQNSIGVLFPAETYQATQANIRSLENSRVEATAAGSAARVTALTGQIQVLQKQLASLTPQVRQAQVLTNEITSATTNLRTAQQALTAKQNLATTAGNDDGLTAARSAPLSRTLPLVEGVAVAMAVALLLGLAIVLVPDLLRRSERDRAARLGRPSTTNEPAASADLPAPLPTGGSARRTGGRPAAPADDRRDAVDYAATTD